MIIGILLTLGTFAQQEEYNIDSVSVAIDTTYSLDDYNTVEPVPTEGTMYFTPKWLQEGGIDSLQWRYLPDSLHRKWKEDDAFWYTELQANSKDPKTRNNPATSRGVSEQPWFETLLWIISIAGFAIFIILYLMNNNIRLFRKNNISIDAGHGEVEMNDIFSINYQREIERSAKVGNYRLAIRLMFLRLLKNLSEKNIIQYKPDRTNLDYLLQLSSTRYYSDFFRLTRNYEYSWYGKFQVSDDAFQVIKKDFEKFDPTIN